MYTIIHKEYVYVCVYIYTYLWSINSDQLKSYNQGSRLQHIPRRCNMFQDVQELRKHFLQSPESFPVLCAWMGAEKTWKNNVLACLEDIFSFFSNSTCIFTFRLKNINIYYAYPQTQRLAQTVEIMDPLKAPRLTLYSGQIVKSTLWV